MSDPFLSVIIPAYNEEDRLPQTLLQITDFLNHQVYSWELIIIENGSQDRTYEIAQESSQHNPQVRVIHENRRDKGLAIQRGMLEAKGKYRFMCDADLSLPFSEVNRFIPPSIDSDIVIASRHKRGAFRYNEPLYRFLGSRLINLMIRYMALPEFKDTQCGFKSFRASVAEDLFNNMTITGWSFDIEILYIARMRNYQIIELPVITYFIPGSKINPIKVGLQMFIDILKIRWNASTGKYQANKED